MDSFGIWYKLKKKDNSNIPKIDLHINLWNIGKAKKNIIEPFIDFGFVIQDFRDIEELKIWFPFNFSQQNFYDLFNEVKENFRLIFNDNSCEISSIADLYYIHESEDKIEKLLIQLNEKEKTISFEKSQDSNDISESNIQILNINFNNIIQNEKFEKYNNVYLRFRIITKNLKKFIFCDLKQKNWFLESAFMATQIIDLKINKERNIPKDECSNFRNNGYLFAKFNKIHFLLMEYANNEISVLGNDFIECRKLETKDWNTYLREEYNTKDILAYHWKKRCNDFDKEPIKEYGKLVKITTSTTNSMILAVYIIIMILLGTFGNFLFTILQYLFKNIFV